MTKKYSKIEKVADRIIQEIEAGNIDPWKKPFGFGEDRARNLKSKQPYKGVNSWLSSMGRYFLSMKEASELHINFSHYDKCEKKRRSGKAYVAEVPIDKNGEEMKPCKGLKSYPIWFKKNCYWLDDKPVQWADILKLMNQYGVENLKELDKKLQEENRTLRTAKYEVLYYVFNVEDLPAEGQYKRLYPKVKEKEIIPIRECLSVLRNLPDKPLLTHRLDRGGSDAYYSPSEDRVNIPYAKDFTSIEEYYSTLFHELVHATGHSDRLGRHDEGQKIVAFGSSDYSKEELVAEFGASMLCGHCGIEEVTLSNSVNYIASWLRVLKNDKTMLTEAIDKAFKAVEYMAGVDSFKDVPEESEEEEVTEIIKPQPESQPSKMSKIYVSRGDFYCVEKIRTSAFTDAGFSVGKYPIFTAWQYYYDSKKKKVRYMKNEKLYTKSNEIFYYLTGIEHLERLKTTKESDIDSFINRCSRKEWCKRHNK